MDGHGGWLETRESHVHEDLHHTPDQYSAILPPGNGLLYLRHALHWSSPWFLSSTTTIRYLQPCPIPWELGAEVEVHRNDELTVEEVEALKPERIVLSPGPARRARPASWSRSSAIWPARRRSLAFAWATRLSARPLAAAWCARAN